MQTQIDMSAVYQRAARRLKGVASVTAEALGMTPYPAQGHFLAATQHFAVFMGGVGAGKSIAGALRALQAAYGRIGSQSIDVPNVGMVTAPTYPMLRDATLRTFRELAGDRIAQYRKSEGVAVMGNGSEVIFRSADDPERLRGPNLAWWWGDEAALYHADVWRIMIGRLRQFGHGYAWLTTTPKGHNWIYKEFVDRQAGNPDYALFKARTRDNPHLSPAYITALEDSYIGDFARQELDAEFVAFEGLVYPEFSRDTHIATDIPQAFVRVLAGVDWGFTNPGVINVFGVTGDGLLYHVHEEYARQRGIDEWADVARQLRDLWRIEVFYCDPSEPDYIAKIEERGCRAAPANNTISTGIQAVKRRLTTRRLLHYRGAVHTFAEYESYEWARRGEVALDQPQKANDHSLDAVRYACMGLEERSRVIEVRVNRWA